MGYRPARHLAPWTRNIGTMAEIAAEVRYACVRCQGVYNVDLASLLRLKGPKFELIDRQPPCKLSRCGGHGFFVAAVDRNSFFITLLHEPPPGLWPPGLRPRDFEPPHDPPPRPAAGRAHGWHERSGDRALRLVK